MGLLLLVICPFGLDQAFHSWDFIVPPLFFPVKAFCFPFRCFFKVRSVFRVSCRCIFISSNEVGLYLIHFFCQGIRPNWSDIPPQSNLD